MPVVEIYGTRSLGAEERGEIKKAVREALRSVSELNLRPQGHIDVLFLREHESYGEKADVRFKISILDKEGRTPEVRGRMSRVVGEAIQRFFPPKTFIHGWPAHEIRREEYWTSQLPEK